LEKLENSERSYIIKLKDANLELSSSLYTKHSDLKFELLKLKERVREKELLSTGLTGKISKKN